MSPALNRSSAIWRFKHSNAIEMYDGITFDNILPDGNCKVVYLDTKLWAGHQKGGRNRERKCRIPRISPPPPPPPALCTKAKVAKGGAYLRDTTVYYFAYYNSNTHVYAAVYETHIKYLLQLCNTMSNFKKLKLP